MKKCFADLVAGSLMSWVNKTKKEAMKTTYRTGSSSSASSRSVDRSSNASFSCCTIVQSKAWKKVFGLGRALSCSNFSSIFRIRVFSFEKELICCWSSVWKKYEQIPILSNTEGTLYPKSLQARLLQRLPCPSTQSFYENFCIGRQRM